MNGEVIKSDTTVAYTGKNLILETDVDGVVVYANRRFVETSGYAKEEIMGFPHCIHMHPGMPSKIFKDACKMTSSGKTWMGYFHNIRKDGSSYWTETSIQPKLSDSNEIIGFLAIRREPDSRELPSVIEEYEKLHDAADESVKSQYCGEVYMGRGACNF